MAGNTSAVLPCNQVGVLLQYNLGPASGTLDGTWLRLLQTVRVTDTVRSKMESVTVQSCESGLASDC
jgi:hypothetical protein